ncbi:MAG TPA: hypothetical protein VLA68_02540 [Nitrososphaera sp.]|nr:hypothetical protein [Nitrososphaera sp.]
MPKEEISKNDRTRPIYDDALLERMKRYYKVEDHDELLKYIKNHGMRRHIDRLEESESL